jgi:hypothetical protein
MVAEKYPPEPDGTVPSELLEVRQQPCGLTALYEMTVTVGGVVVGDDDGELV